MDQASVLVIEDDPSVASVVATALRARGHHVEIATTGRAGLDAASASEPSMVVLDLGLPDIDGIEVCRHLRRWYRNPIIVLSADGDEDRKVAALDDGADDYVTKPFSMPELLARLRVAERHHALTAAARRSMVEVGALTIDVDGHRATIGRADLDLAPKEFALLLLLARQPGRVITHRAILDQVWGTADLRKTDTLRVHVTQLRRKLGAEPGGPEILSEPGVGYRLVAPS